MSNVSGWRWVLLGVAWAMLALPGSAAATGDANMSSCAAFGSMEASPGFRAYLPDCRGLELATPPYKGGQPLLATAGGQSPISPDGRRLIGIDFAGFDETGNLEESSDFGAPYELSRGSAGWSSEALSPPSSLAARSSFLEASTDLSSELFEGSEEASSGEEVSKVTGYTVYLRTGEGGNVHWSTVGPAQPEPLPGDEDGGLVFAGASDNLGVALFEPDSTEPKYWPGDPTPGLPSLYQYRGVGNSEPELVGIANNGPLSGTPKNAGAVLESQCGTILGSANTTATTGLPVGSASNAISSSGEVVYFSALHTECGLAEPPATELFARVEGGLANAHTVAISEPSKADCAECDTSEPQEAVFEGATSDGATVFFLSEQALLPGASGQSLYAFDLQGAPGDRLKLVAADVSGVSRVADDGGRVYFVSTESLPAAPDSTLAPGSDAPVPGQPNMYVWNGETGEYAFVAPLAEADSALWTRKDERPIQATADGAYVVFPSAAHLTADDLATTPQLFEYDAVGHKLSRVSIGQVGQYACPSTGSVEAYDCDGNLNGVTGPQLLAPLLASIQHPAVSRLELGSAGEVVFTSPDALTPGAVNDRPLQVAGGEEYVENVYEYRAGNVYLISPANEEAPLQTPLHTTRVVGMSPEGSDVFFMTTSKLVPQDVDTQADWYDARVGGGLPPEPAPPTCGEGTCQPPPTSAPPNPLPNGTELSSGETLVPASPSAATTPKPAPKPLSRQAKLKKALKQCATERKRARRVACEKLAQRRFGKAKKSKAKKSAHATRGGAHR